MISLGCVLNLCLVIVLVSGGYLFGPRFGVSREIGAATGGAIYLLSATTYIAVKTAIELLASANHRKRSESEGEGDAAPPSR